MLHNERGQYRQAVFATFRGLIDSDMLVGVLVEILFQKSRLRQKLRHFLPLMRQIEPNLLFLGLDHPSSGITFKPRRLIFL